jgi:hypothetical protein
MWSSVAFLEYASSGEDGVRFGGRPTEGGVIAGNIELLKAGETKVPVLKDGALISTSVWVAMNGSAPT